MAKFRITTVEGITLLIPAECWSNNGLSNNGFLLCQTAEPMPFTDVMMKAELLDRKGMTILIVNEEHAFAKGDTFTVRLSFAPSEKKDDLPVDAIGTRWEL